MKTVVITGAAAGIGRATLEHFHREGWRVFAVDVDKHGLETAATEFGCDTIVADVRHSDEIKSASDTVKSRCESIDALVNSAGTTRTGPSESFSAEDWLHVLDVNLSGTFYSCQAFVSGMSAGSSIVNLASITASRGLPGRAAYTATKSAIVGLTRVLAVEWAEKGVRVNAVGPAWTDTPLLRSLIDTGRLHENDLVRRIPMGRLATPADVASAIAFLVSDGASFITGQTLYVDGGYLWAG